LNSHLPCDLESRRRHGIDVRDLRARIDSIAERFDGRFAQVDGRFAQVDGRFAQVDRRFDDFRDRLEALELRLSGRINGMERSIGSTKVWALLLFIAQAAAVYGTLARTMGWI
jgi:hypothetical protein